MFVKLKRLKDQVNISATFMKPFIKANCAIFNEIAQKRREEDSFLREMKITDAVSPIFCAPS